MEILALWGCTNRLFQLVAPTPSPSDLSSSPSTPFTPLEPVSRFTRISNLILRRQPLHRRQRTETRAFLRRRSDPRKRASPSTPGHSSFELSPMSSNVQAIGEGSSSGNNSPAPHRGVRPIRTRSTSNISLPSEQGRSPLDRYPFDSTPPRSQKYLTPESALEFTQTRGSSSAASSSRKGKARAVDPPDDYENFTYR